MADLKYIKEKILKAKAIVIAGHINPDGDSIGSLLSLGLGLKKMGKRVYMLSPDGLPRRYALLPAAAKVIRSTTEPPDLAIAVDCSNKEILGKVYPVFKKAQDILEIDHHEFRRPFGNLFFLDNKAAAVGELVYILLKELKVNIDRDIAQNLLTSIIVETDSFRLPGVRPLTFEVCARLMKKGVDFYKLVDMVFWSKTRESVILSGRILARSRFKRGNRLIWSVATKKDFAATGSRDEDIDDLADQMRSMQGVEIAVLFREKGRGHLRVSLRSKGKINIAAIAEYYGGGGHFDVAGCPLLNTAGAVRGLLGRAEALLD